jgi:hypothetical protein
MDGWIPIRIIKSSQHFYKRRDPLTKNYLDNFDNESSNKYEKNT